MNSTTYLKRSVNPRLPSNWISLITFFYTINLFRKGNKRDINENDIYEVIPKMDAKKLGRHIELEWNKEQSRKHPSLIKVTLKCFGKEYFFYVSIMILLAVLLVLLQPFAVSNFISHFQLGNESNIYIYGVTIIILAFLNCVVTQNINLLIYKLGIKIQSSFTSLIYRKLLRLDCSLMSETVIGQITTLITKDLVLLTIVLDYTSNLWFSIIQICVMWCIIYMKLGYAVLTGLGIFFVILVIMTICYMKIYQARNKTFENTRKRIRLVQETLQGIKIIKMNCWEKHFQKRINDVRRLESKGILKLSYYKALVLGLGAQCYRLCIYGIIVTYVLMGNNLTVEMAYLIINLFQTIQKSMLFFIPVSTEHVIEFIAIMKQLQTFLQADEIQDSKDNSSNDPRIYFDNVAIQIKNETILKNISMDLKTGLFVVTGSIGSGKTVILKTIFNDLRICEGIKKVNGTISYAPQQPWVFTGTIRQNILFGQKFNEYRYETILRICTLDYDIKQMVKGDETVISVDGNNLSTGQLSRISLARAIYKKSDIYLLDDCLSVLDTTVSNFIYEECIVKFLKDSLTILITRNKLFVRKANKVLKLKKDTNETETFDYEICNEVKESTEKLTLPQETDKLLEQEIIPTDIYCEAKKCGRIKFDIYQKYVNYGGGIFMVLLIIVCFIIFQILDTSTISILTQWAVLEEKFQNSTVTNGNIFENVTVMKYLYSTVIFVELFMSFWYFISFYIFNYKVSINIHKEMTAAVIWAKMIFFQKYHQGTILNRFSNDIFITDEILAYFVFCAVMATSIILGGIVLLILTNPITIFFVLLSLLFVFIIIRHCASTLRSLKRLECITFSPIVDYVNNSLKGLDVIRASKSQQILQNEFDNYQNVNASVTFMLHCTTRGFLLSLEFVSNLLLSSTVIFFMFFGQNISPGTVGLTINQVAFITFFLRNLIEFWVVVDYHMTSVERVEEFITTEKETNTGQILENWSVDGKIQYKNVNLCFSQSRTVLKNINFIIQPGEKICIVGRTGAGKSSLISSLFRIYDTDGTITIDNVNIKLLNLDFLRSNLAIIPQEPILFSGTIRFNIDPNNKYTDAEIWKILHKIRFSKISSLDLKVLYGGSQFSTGEKQLICMARALLDNKKIVVMDEATANLDSNTECEVQKCLKDNFQNCTLIVILHKLKYIDYYDKVMVIDKGEILEFDDPRKLLDDKTSAFFKMYEQYN